jgi:hypothetical protein
MRRPYSLSGDLVLPSSPASQARARVPAAFSWGCAAPAQPRPSGGDGVAGPTIPRYCDAQPVLRNSRRAAALVFGSRSRLPLGVACTVGSAKFPSRPCPLRWRGRRFWQHGSGRPCLYGPRFTIHSSGCDGAPRPLAAGGPVCTKLHRPPGT